MPGTRIATIALLRRNSLSVFFLVLAALGGVAVQADESGEDSFSHEAFSRLLAQCVHATSDGGSTAVDYDCFIERRAALSAYLHSLASVDERSFQRWHRDDQLAFLINAYNAATVELILTGWPDLESIKDLGSLLRSPWKKRFVSLLGEELTLDNIEHDMIREPGRFDEPRIHFAVNCASIGCPALRREAYTGAELERQLEDQTRSFLRDQTRNRFEDNRLKVTSLFKWYRGDFEQGWRGADSLEQFLDRYADDLGLDSAARMRLRSGDLSISFLDYDWALNATRRP